MNMTEVLIGASWDAGLEHYDFLCRVEFRSDGSGTMKFGGGQVLELAADFTYRIADNNRFEFEFFDTTLEFWGQTFWRTDENAFHSVGFEIIEGDFMIEEPYIGRQTYRRKLAFSESPFPMGTLWPLDRNFLDFYGWHKMEANSQSQDG
jgi:hypothetical protein